MGRDKAGHRSIYRRGVSQVVIQNDEVRVADLARRLALGTSINGQEAEDYMFAVLSLPDPDLRLAQLGVLLSALGAHCKDPQIVVGAVKAALRFGGSSIESVSRAPSTPVLGVAGSGKKSIRTANLSTAACFMAASVGCRIIKSVSAATASVAGSADTLDALGVHVCESSECAGRHIPRTGLAFLRIESRLPAFDAIYGGNFLAPHLLSLALPAAILPSEVTHIAYGLAHPNVATSAKAIAMLKPGTRVSVFASHDLTSGTWLDEAVGSHISLAQWPQDTGATPEPRRVSLSGLWRLGVLSVDAKEARTIHLEELLHGHSASALQQSAVDSAVMLLLAGEQFSDPELAEQAVWTALRAGGPADLFQRSRRLRSRS